MFNNNYVQSHIQSAIQQLVGDDATVKSFEKWDKVYFVQFWNYSPTFVSIKKVLYLASLSLAKQRREKAQTVTVKPHPVHAKTFVARAEGLDTSYFIYLDHDGMGCQCKDFRNLQVGLNQRNVACKHIYAMLNHLGYSSLSAYVNEGRKGGNQQFA